jgi:hypothetical protein
MPAGIVPDSDVPGKLNPLCVVPSQDRDATVFCFPVRDMIVFVIIIGVEILGIEVPVIIFFIGKHGLVKKPIHIGKQIKAVGSRLRLAAKKHNSLVFFPQPFHQTYFIGGKIPGLPVLETALHKEYFVFIPIEAIVGRLGKMKKASESLAEKRLHGVEKGYALVADQNGYHFLNRFLIMERTFIASMETGE